MRITVAIPYFRKRSYICKAVESILDQSYQDLLVVVVNDGDDEPPWKELAHIDDPRLIRFDLPVNKGPYFATAVMLYATPDTYFGIQDADDWSEPTRLERLMNVLQAEEASFVTSAGFKHAIGESGPTVKRYDGFPSRGRSLTNRFNHHFMHHGLYQTEALYAIGGYDAGLRYAYEMLLTNFILMTGKVAYVDEPLYHRQILPDSVTTSKKSGFRSPLWINEVQQLRGLYQQAFVQYSAYQNGTITYESLTEQICDLAALNVSREEQVALEYEAQRLRSFLP